MAVIDSYSFYSGNIPVKISIESDRNEFVLVYKVSISQISPNTEIVLDKIRDELVDKVKLGIGDVTDPKKLDYVKEKFRKTNLRRCPIHVSATHISTSFPQSIITLGYTKQNKSQNTRRNGA